MKFSTQLVIFFLGMNAFAAALAGAGFWQHTGVNPGVEDNSNISSAAEGFDGDDVSSTGGGCQTLLCYGSRAATLFSDAYGMLTYGFTLLEDAGVPWQVTAMFQAVIGFIIARDITMIIFGR